MTRVLTADARRALVDAGFSRRAFLRGSGALIVTFGSAGLAHRLSAVFAQGFNGTGSTQLDSWIAIATDGTVTAYTGKCDFGQGLYTAQMQLVAEELCVPFARVRLVQCDTSMTPDQGTTSGQQSHPTNFNQTNLALAAATARETLVRLASTRLGASPQDLVAQNGTVSVRAMPARNGRLRQPGRRPQVRGPPRPAGQAETSARVDGARHAGASSRHAGHGHGAIRVRPQRACAGHAARARGAAAVLPARRC